MEHKELWNKKIEIEFFNKTLEVTPPEKLFYITDEGRYIAYWPNNYKGTKSTLQSRNTFIGDFTEKWVRDLLESIGKQLNVFVLNNIICDEIGLSRNSAADVAICRQNQLYQNPEDILLIIEVKMSLVWNWEFDINTKEIIYLGDYTSHRGIPSLLRSDTVLKAIGKSVNIRVSSPKSSRIPIIVLGNTPITKNYYNHIDHLKRCGIVQGFFSLNPEPLDNMNNYSNIKFTADKGFMRFDSFIELAKTIIDILGSERIFFSGMKSKNNLGKIIELANKESTYEKKAEVFLNLLRENEV